MEFKKVFLSELIPAGYNPRKNLKSGDPEYERIKRSISEFGYVDPVIINSDNTVIGGHQRLNVLKDLGHTQIDVVVVDLPKGKEKALNIALNKITGEWDNGMLTNLLSELKDDGEDISLTGFDDKEFERLLNETQRDDEINDAEAKISIADELQKEWKTEAGQLWGCGDHRVICGDGTKEETIATLMCGQKADAIFTDPPYNVNYEGKTKDALKIQNDKMACEVFRSFLLESFQRMFDYSKAGAVAYVCHADSEGYNFRGAFCDAGWMLKQCIIWKKQQFVMGRQDYQWKHEPILYGWKPGGAHQFYGGRTQTTVWDIDRPMANKEHPTMKPVELVTTALKNSTKGGDIVLDLFLGSGTTIIACENIDRVGYGAEIDPGYVAVILQRYKDLTGNDPVLMEDK